MAVFQEVNHEDFSGLLGVMPHIDTTTSGTYNYGDLINPWIDNSSPGVTDPLVDNCMAVNQAVTPTYSTTNIEHTARLLAWHWNEVGNNKVFEHHAQRGPVGGYYLSGRVAQHKTTGEATFESQTINGATTDGFLQIQEPHATAFGNSYHKDHSVQTGVRVKLSSPGGVPPFTWVPILGVGLSRGGAHEAINSPDAELTYYQKTENGHGYLCPPLANNADTKAGNQLTGNWHSHMATYLIYCHDGAGGVMLATAPGMSPDGQAYARSNASKTATANIMSTNDAYGVKNGLIRYNAPKILTDHFEANQSLSYLWDQYKNNTRRLYGHTVNYTQDHEWNDRGNSSWANFWSHFNLIGYKTGVSNADLSTPEEFYINWTSAAANTTNPYKLNRWGVYWAGATMHSSYNHHGSYQFAGTGKIKDFTFVNQHLFHGYDFTREVRTYISPKMLILHAHAETGTVIHDFSIGSYAPHTRVGRYIGDGPFKDYMGYNYNLEYIYPGDGHTYNPLRDNHGDASKKEDEAGNSPTTWVNIDSMLDNSDSTFASAKNIGPEHAIYLKLNGVETSAGTVLDAEIVQELTIQIRGFEQLTIDPVVLHFALTKNDKSNLVQTTAKQSVAVPDGELVGTGNVYPDKGSAFTVTFRNDGANNMTYGNLKDGYLKMWVELR